MSRSFRFVLPAAFSAAALGTLALGLACKGTADEPTPTPTGQVTFSLTDAPSDAWSSVEVAIKSVTLLTKGDHAKTVVALKGNSTRINLVELDEVAAVLGTLDIPAGTYDAVVLEVDTDPANIKLVRADGTRVPTSQLRVAGTGNIAVTLAPALTVTAGQSSQVQIDFNLAHPVFLVDLADGSVCLNLSAPGLLRHKALGAAGMVEFNRAQGLVQSVQSTGFKMNTRFGADLNLVVNPASTWFFNVDTRAAGSFSDLSPGKAVAVMMNLQADGSLFARRVWVSSDPAKLPDWSPEGHVTAVNTANGTVSVRGAEGLPVTYTVNSGTTFTWHATNGLGTGTTGLGTIRPGFKVNLVVADPTATPKVLTSLNVQRARDEGFFTAVNTSSFTFGAAPNDRTYAYSTTPAFTWWPFADPMSASTNVTDFAAAASVGMAQGHARAHTSLAWSGGAWKSLAAILMPERVPGRATVAGYDGATKTLSLNYVDGTTTGSVTLKLSDTLPVSTGVFSLSLQNGVVSLVQVPVANWSTALVPNAKLSATFVPTAGGALNAYTVVLLP